MSGPRTVGVVIGDGPPAAAAEGLRAAVGLTLRGDRVELAITDGALAATGADGARATATLQLFGHGVRAVGRDRDAAAPALAADVVELWADGAAALTEPVDDGPRARLHLLRPGRRPPITAPRDAVLSLPAGDHEPGDDPGDEPGDDPGDDYDEALLDAILFADVVIVW